MELKTVQSKSSLQMISITMFSKKLIYQSQYKALKFYSKLSLEFCLKFWSIRRKSRKFCEIK
jgi:hypothetical protein